MAQSGTDDLARTVVAMGATVGLQLDATCERLTVVDETGAVLGGQELLVLFAYLAATHDGAQSVAVPVVATAALDELGLKVVRTRVEHRALMEAALAPGVALCGDGRGSFALTRFQPGMDALFAAGQLVAWLSREARPLSALRARLPASRLEETEIACPWEAKGRVMRLLAEAFPQAELVDGVKVRRGKAWAAVVPDARRPVVHLAGEPAGAGILAELRRCVAVALEGGEA